MSCGWHLGGGWVRSSPQQVHPPPRCQFSAPERWVSLRIRSHGHPPPRCQFSAPGLWVDSLLTYHSQNCLFQHILCRNLGVQVETVQRGTLLLIRERDQHSKECFWYCPRIGCTRKPLTKRREIDEHNRFHRIQDAKEQRLTDALEDVL